MDNKRIFKKILSSYLKLNKLSNKLTNFDQIKKFFDQLSNDQNNTNNLYAQYILRYIYEEFSNAEIRDRRVTSSDFEDFVGSIFNLKPEDKNKNKNPPVSNYIRKLENSFNKADKNFSIADDLSGNKNKKKDLKHNGINVSIKTLKGKTPKDSKANTEINIGAISYRSAFYGVEGIDIKLGDRKDGLGSGSQLNTIFEKIKNKNKFRYRLKGFLDYLYKDINFIIAFKADKKMQIIFIKGTEFIDLLIKLFKKDHEIFTKIFYRWEHDAVRIHIQHLLNDKFSKFWTANDWKDLKDYPKYHDVNNPFSKKNITILNLEKSITNKKLNSILKKNTDNYYSSLLNDLGKKS